MISVAVGGARQGGDRAGNVTSTEAGTSRVLDCSLGWNLACVEMQPTGLGWKRQRAVGDPRWLAVVGMVVPYRRTKAPTHRHTVTPSQHSLWIAAVRRIRVDGTSNDIAVQQVGLLLESAGGCDDCWRPTLMKCSNFVSNFVVTLLMEANKQHFAISLIIVGRLCLASPSAPLFLFHLAAFLSTSSSLLSFAPPEM